MKTINSAFSQAPTLDSRIASEVQALVRLLVDSENGFADASESVKHAEVATLFRTFVSERSKMAAELQDLLRDCGDIAPASGTLMGTIHRNWLDMRNVLSGQDTYAILVEAERGEDYIKGEYQRALKMVIGDKIHSLLSMHYLMIQAAHDRVQELRESYQSDSF